MSRPIPPCPDQPKASDPAVRLAFRLITPMFGGGVEPGVNDPVTPIRPSTIRGQLRFWWRATRGAAYSDIEALRRRESAIWGDLETPSPVEITVTVTNRGTPQPCNQVPQSQQYALFPFQGRKAGIPIRSGTKGIEFQVAVRLRHPDTLSDDVQGAFWAWANFGGVGARTRRGCGSLLCADLAPVSSEHIADWFGSAIQKYGLSVGEARPWPTLSNTVLYRRESDPALNAWDRTIGLLQHFRQGENWGRNPGQQPNRPGRSRYPEPETIRRLTGCRMARHERLRDIPDDAFPRAELGLPIVFHFKDARKDHGVGIEARSDPPDTILNPIVNGEEKSRMASPLILKPLALATQQAVPMILLLSGPRLEGVRLIRDPDQHWDSSTIRHPRLARYPLSPLGGSLNGSAIEAFLAFACSKGFVPLEVG